MARPLQVFCCYAHTDRLILNKLRNHLRVLEYDQLITVQADIDIKPGDE